MLCYIWYLFISTSIISNDSSDNLSVNIYNTVYRKRPAYDDIANSKCLDCMFILLYTRLQRKYDSTFSLFDSILSQYTGNKVVFEHPQIQHYFI